MTPTKKNIPKKTITEKKLTEARRRLSEEVEDHQLTIDMLTDRQERCRELEKERDVYKRGFDRLQSDIHEMERERRIAQLECASSKEQLAYTEGLLKVAHDEIARTVNLGAFMLVLVAVASIAALILGSTP